MAGLETGSMSAGGRGSHGQAVRRASEEQKMRGKDFLGYFTWALLVIAALGATILTAAGILFAVAGAERSISFRRIAARCWYLMRCHGHSATAFERE